MMLNFNKNIYKLLIIIHLLFFISGNIFAQEDVLPRDIYKVKTAKMTEEGAIDFKIYSTFQKLKEKRIVQTVVGDTLINYIHSTLGDIYWNFKYGYRDNIEFNLAGGTFVDMKRENFRYGASDTKLGIKIGYPGRNSNFNASVELYYLLPTGFSEGDRLVRSFSFGKGALGINNAVEFNFNRFNFLVNLGYFHYPTLYDKIPENKFLVWYPSLEGYQGLTSDGEIISSRQISIGIGGELDVIFNRKLFFEYRSSTILTKRGDSQTIGKFAGGVTLTTGDNFIVKLGYETSTIDIEPKSSFFLDVRLNSVFKSRKVRGPTVPTITERPALEAGAKPFFVKEGVVFSKTREPINDTILLIDASPSMIGRGLDPNNRGENVLRDIVEFTQTVIDSIQENSNISLITYSNTVNILSWRSVNEARRKDIKNSIKDIPDEAIRIATQYENEQSANQQFELVAEAILRAYEELESFKRGDYNRIHLQRIILFTDGIYDGEFDLSKFKSDIEALLRRYNINRDDFRYFYYVFTNVRGEEKVNYDLVSLVEEENGKVFRKVDVNNRDHITLGGLNYENISSKEIFRYFSQITRLAILPFNSKGNTGIGSYLTGSFREVFDYNQYFQLAPQDEVIRVLENYGIKPGEKLKLEMLQKIGKQLDADYVVYGELLNFEERKSTRFFIPYLISFPTTSLSVTVAINLINVADGSLAYVSNISTSKSKSRGISFFPSSKEDRTKTLDAIEKENLNKELVSKWINKVLGAMFEDVSVIKP